MSRIVVLGLAITSSWGNGHATTYRGLVAALCRRGHDVLFLERDRAWYAAHRDLRELPGARVELYGSVEELQREFGDAIAAADLVIVGSYVPAGADIGDFVLDRATGLCAFYDIDTPVTLQRLRDGDCEYLRAEQIPRYRLYLSFTGGPILRHLERALGSPRAVALPCSADAAALPQQRRGPPRYDLGYLGTYSADRHENLQRLLLEPAAAWPQGRFVVAGPMFPDRADWPPNVDHVEHLPPERHVAFYRAQRFTLNVTRGPMRQWGHSPSVRLFEAAACGVPVISDRWDGIGDSFEPGREILVADGCADVLRALRGDGAADAGAIGRAARLRLLRDHTPDCRAAVLEAELRRHAGAHRAPARMTEGLA